MPSKTATVRALRRLAHPHLADCLKFLNGLLLCLESRMDPL